MMDSGSHRIRDLTARKWVGYSLAAVFTALTFLLRWRLSLVVDRPFLILFVIPVLLSAYLGGLGPGLLATVLSAFGAEYLVLPPVHSFRLAGTVDLLQWVVFCVAGVLISLLTGAMQRSSRRAQQAERRSGELLAQQREAEARRASEQKFQQERDQIAAVLNTIGSLVVVLDRQGSIVRMNRACEQTTGYAAEEVVGKRVWEVFILPEEREAVRGVFASLAAGRFPTQYENHWRTKDGGRRLIAWSNTVMADAQGRVEHVIGTGIDVTEQRRAESALRESEAQARRIIDNQLAFVGVTTPDGTVVEINAPAVRISGLERAEIVGKKFWDCYWWTYEERVRQQMRQAVEKAIDGQSVRFDVIARIADDGHLPIDFMLVPVRNTAGQVTHLIPSAIDISERKRAEQAMGEAKEAAEQSQLEQHAIIESMTEGLAVFDLQGNLLDMNSAALAIHGFDSVDAVRHNLDRLAEIFEIRDLQGNRVPVEQWPVSRVLRGETFDRYDVQVCRTDGGKQWIASYGGTLVRDAHGQPNRAVVTLRDVTDVKRAEQELHAAKLSAERAKAAAEEASQAKDHFLAVLSHELRNPLTPVLPALAAVQKLVPEEGREYLEIARRNVELEARLIDDLLDVTRIARGKIELDRKVVELCTIVHRAAEVCRPDIEARRLHFGVKVEHGPQPVHVDAARLQQVFWNLIKNAVKFTPHGGCVGVRAWRENGQAIVQVIDSGQGIEPRALDRIFDAFEQESRSTTRQFGGLGLGLAISKALVEMHGGTIQVQSAGKGKGATFTVALPIAALRPMEELTAPVPETQAPAEARHLKILLVEDHGDTARMMGRLLSAEGHAVQHAGDVATALELASGEEFDLLVSDLGLPDGSGHDLMRRLRARGWRLPGVALSGYGMAEDVKRSHEAGFAEHVTKPVNYEALLAAVTRVAGAVPA